MSDKPQSAREAALAACYMLCEVFGQDVSEHMLKAWRLALEDLPIQDIELATVRAIKESTFMPRPAELRKMITGGGEDADAMALTAYTQVEQAVSLVGGYKSPDFADPLINATVRHLGGWVQICDLPESEFKWFRKDFLATYKKFHQHPPSPEACAPLLGIHYKQNGSYHKHDKPTQIGSHRPLPQRLQDLRREVDEREKFKTNRPANLPKPQLKRIGTDGEVITE